MFKDKVAIVTASGRGMGKAIAQDLAASGAKVVVCARTIKYGEETLAEFKAAGGQASLVQLDVTHRQSVKDLVLHTAEKWGRLDIVVHCAADNPFSFIEHMQDEYLDTMFNSILKSSFWLAHDTLSLMKKSGPGGRMVFISSISGNRINIPGYSHYGAAKAGLSSMVRGAALEFAPYDITVNAIEPGLIRTQKMESHLNEEQIQAISKGVPLRREGTTQDIINAVRFLASPASSYITGTSLVVDGGSSLGGNRQVSDSLNH